MSCCFTDKKSALERLDWVLDYSRFLCDGDTLTSVEAEADHWGLWEITPEIEGDKVRIWFAGGFSGERYRINVQVTTALGRVKTDCMTLRVIGPPWQEWPSPDYVNNWADRIFHDCRLGY